MSPPESRDEMMRMQQDAIRRVREMQQRANQNLERSNQLMGHTHDGPTQERERSAHQEASKGHGHPIPAEPQSQQPQQREENVPVPQQAPGLHLKNLGLDGIAGILNRFGLEDDTLLIMALLWVLWSNDADNWLLMALVYLIL